MATLTAILFLASIAAPILAVTLSMPLLPDGYYTAEQLKTFNIGDSTLRKWRRQNGLQAKYFGRAVVYPGREIIRCIEETSTDRWDSSPTSK